MRDMKEDGDEGKRGRERRERGGGGKRSMGTIILACK